MNSDKLEDAVSGKFLEWAKKFGIQHTLVEAKFVQEGTRGLVATEAIEIGKQKERTKRNINPPLKYFSDAEWKFHTKKSTSARSCISKHC